MYELTNRKNGKKVIVSAEDFETIKKKGWLKTIFTFEVMKGNHTPKGSYVPAEVENMKKKKDIEI